MSSDDPTITDETQREFEALAGLLRSAGRRIDPPDAARQQAFAVAFEAWREKSATVRRRRTAGWLAAGSAIAAGVIGLVLNDWPWRAPLDVPTVPVARLERGVGTVETRLPGERDWRLLDDHAPLIGGASIRTSFGSVWLSNVGGKIDVDNSNGSIEVQTAPSPTACAPISLETSFGGIVVRLPESAGYTVDARTSFGKIKSELPLTIAGSPSSELLNGRIGNGQCPLTLANSNGGIRPLPLSMRSKRRTETPISRASHSRPSTCLPALRVVDC